MKLSKFFEISIDWCSGNIEIDFSVEGFHLIEYADGEYLITQDLHQELNFKEMYKIKGVCVRVRGDCVSVYNDIFCSIPVFYKKNKDRLILTSNVDRLDLGSEHKDDVGLWESLIFGYTLHDRTIYKNVKQFFSANKLSISNKGAILSERYFDFSFFEDKTLTIDSACKKLDAILSEIYNAMPEDDYVMGVSGGLDSRLSLCYFSKYQSGKNLSAFTYSASKNSLELKSAQSLCESFNIPAPDFFKLEKGAYEQQVNFLPYFSLSQVGFQHAHICSYLEENMIATKRRHISNYYSDALFGYACEGEELSGSDSYIDQLAKYDRISEEIESEIRKDIEKTVSQYSESFNYSSVNEYRYVIERNPKFHFFLAYLQGQFVDTITPMADYELLSFMMSMPLKFRKDKLIIKKLLENYFPMLTAPHGISSLYFKSSQPNLEGKLYDFFEKLPFKLNNILSALVTYTTRGKIIFPNKYYTESHASLAYYFDKDLSDACKFFHQLGIFDKVLLNKYRKPTIKSADISFQVQMISIYKSLKRCV